LTAETNYLLYLISWYHFSTANPECTVSCHFHCVHQGWKLKNYTEINVSFTPFCISEFCCDVYGNIIDRLTMNKNQRNS